MSGRIFGGSSSIVAPVIFIVVVQMQDETLPNELFGFGFAPATRAVVCKRTFDFAFCVTLRLREHRGQSLFKFYVWLFVFWISNSRLWLRLRHGSKATNFCLVHQSLFVFGKRARLFSS